MMVELKVLESKSVITSDNLVTTPNQDSTMIYNSNNFVGLNPKDSIVIEPEERLQKQEFSSELIAKDSIETKKLKHNIEKALKRPKGKSMANSPYAVFYSSVLSANKRWYVL